MSDNDELRTKGRAIVDDALDLRAWITVIAVLLGFFAVPLGVLVLDRRRQRRLEQRHGGGPDSVGNSPTETFRPAEAPWRSIDYRHAPATQSPPRPVVRVRVLRASAGRPPAPSDIAFVTDTTPTLSER